ncbi:four helix bundle protein [Jiulongibacter sediminis]|uniref:four helix bundle protein n=1 Tax=Jiulongibacter sediminis TaxID=1605367 RepID=UPI0026ED37C8|nr:four helix bundle protein [Jiulongibacter sediminis]
MMRDFKNYSVWERSHKLVLSIYELTKAFPKEELYGITSQIRRAAVSVPTNIVEGCGRESDAEFKRFLSISSGSLSEVNYLLILSNDLAFISLEEFNGLEEELTGIHKSIHSLMKKLK